MYLSYSTRTLATHGISKYEIKTSGLRGVPLCQLVNIHRRLQRSQSLKNVEKYSICAKTERNYMEDVNSQCVCFFQDFPRHTAHTALQVYCTHVYIRGEFLTFRIRIYYDIGLCAFPQPSDPIPVFYLQLIWQYFWPNFCLTSKALIRPSSTSWIYSTVQSA
jgi:hypothetical protein